MRPLIPALALAFLTTPLALCADKTADAPQAVYSPNSYTVTFVGTGIGSLALMPVPKETAIISDTKPLAVTGTFSIALTGAAANDERVSNAVVRLLQRWRARTDLQFTALAPDGTLVVNTATTEVGFSSPDGSFVPTGEMNTATFIIDATDAAPTTPELGEDETYKLTVHPFGRRVTLNAPTTTGVLRGLATLTQLLQQNADATGYILPNIYIDDAPRFPWRGLMIDASRHWMPIEVVKRQLDGMELVKLNVLHFHLSDDQGFRIESKTHPELHEKGSDGQYFTQEQIREIIRYAAARGIRVVPEFDMPGHTTSWAVARPDLASGPPPRGAAAYQLERTWGVFDTVLDPTNEAVFKFLDEFLGEMAALFPDAYFHIGGDENNGKQWNANPAIQKFIADHNLKDNAGLQAYFSNRVGKILGAHGKKIVGWEEILHGDLAPGSVIQAWRGKGLALAAAAKAGYPVILSAGNYIDLNLHAADHYLNDPLPAGTLLTPAQQKLILGGEAPMWAEWVTPETIDSRIWPRTAAIAERLWSPQTIRDVDDMYRRLDIISQRLDEAGLLHLRNRAAMLARLAGANATPAQLAAMRAFSDALEPVKRYQRNKLQRGSTQQTPLDGLVDATVTDSASARQFNADVAAYLAARKTDLKKAAQLFEKIDAQFNSWISASDIVATQLDGLSPHLTLAAYYAVGVRTACLNGQFALRVLEKKRKEPENGSAFFELALKAIDKTTQPTSAAVEFPALSGIKQLINVAIQSNAAQ